MIEVVAVSAAGEVAVAAKKSISCERAVDEGRGQTGVDVTCGSQGTLDGWGDNTPLPFPDLVGVGVKPVNIHYHLGSEHSSYGEYDLEFRYRGPSDEYVPEHLRLPVSRVGKRCGFYDKDDSRYNPELNSFKWKYCTNTTVGETYEFHWPSSAFGSSTLDDEGLAYQGAFPDGLLCNANQDVIDAIAEGGAQTFANSLAVQAQIFTVIDDDAYDMDPDEVIAGMVVREDRGVPGTPSKMGKRLTAYTGSRTGGSFGSSKYDPNRGCDPISPVTWHVDRQCHLISAKTMDQVCGRMMDIGRGMVRCTDSCLGMPLRAVFKNPSPSENFPGEYCCYPDAAVGSSRNSNDSQLANNNRIHIVDEGVNIGGSGAACEAINTPQ